jgi:hypothetical protein
MKQRDTTARPGTETGPPAPWLDEFDSVKGRVRAVSPPGTWEGRPLSWPFALTGYGRDRPEWVVDP